jgi:hypothetical protein
MKAMITIARAASADDSEEPLDGGEGGAAGWLDGEDGEGGEGAQGGFGGGSSAATGGEGGGPPPCECDDGEPCNGLESCAADGSCVTSEPAPPTDDGNKCTVDVCYHGITYHRPIVPDDNDPCTSQWCDPELGITGIESTACIECTDLNDHNACTWDECNSDTGKSRHRPVLPYDEDQCTIEECHPTYGITIRLAPECQN